MVSQAALKKKKKPITQEDVQARAKEVFKDRDFRTDTSAPINLGKFERGSGEVSKTGQKFNLQETAKQVEDFAQSQAVRDEFGQNEATLQAAIAAGFVTDEQVARVRQIQNPDVIENGINVTQQQKRLKEIEEGTGRSSLGGNIAKGSPDSFLGLLGDIATVAVPGSAGATSAGVKGTKAAIKGGAKAGAKEVASPVARITRQVSAHELNTFTGKLLPRGHRQTQRAFIGKPANLKSNKLFNIGTKSSAKGFATNTKSVTLTKNMLIGAGISIFIADKIVDALSTYPFAGFIEEEALQSTQFGFNQASKNGDLIGMAEEIALQEQMLADIDSYKSDLPYINVINAVDSYVIAAKANLKIQKRTLEKKQLEGGN